MDKRSSNREILYMVAIVVAVALIGFGVYNVWRSFERFDNSILTEKDTQFYSLMRSDDINIENSINALVREAETYFSRVMLKNQVDNWRETGDATGLESFIKENSLRNNPIYADLVVLRKGDVFLSASGSKGYRFLTGKDTNGIRLCVDDKGVYYLSYEYDVSNKLSYDVLIDLERFYSTAVGVSLRET